MKNPQYENAFTKIAHELVEALARTRISGECMRVLWAILRHSYGYHRKSAQLSLERISDITGLDRRNVNRAKNKLLSTKIIFMNKDGYVNIYSLNKNYESWDNFITGGNKPACSQNRCQTDVKNDVKTAVNIDTHKRKKEKLNKDEKFFSEFWSNYPFRNNRKLGKKECFEWICKNVKESDLNKLLTALDNYKKDPVVISGYSKDPIRFLRNRDWGWKDWIEPSKENEKNISIEKIIEETLK